MYSINMNDFIINILTNPCIIDDKGIKNNWVGYIYIRLIINLDATG